MSSNNKTDCHDVTEILLKGALSIITLTLTLYYQERNILYIVHIIECEFL